MFVLTLCGAFRILCIPAIWLISGIFTLNRYWGGLAGSGKLVDAEKGSMSFRYWTRQVRDAIGVSVYREPRLHADLPLVTVRLTRFAVRCAGPLLGLLTLSQAVAKSGSPNVDVNNVWNVVALFYYSIGILVYFWSGRLAIKLIQNFPGERKFVICGRLIS